MTKLAVLDSTVQKTHEWLRDIKEGLGLDDEQAAYTALRATLHALRDCLNTDEAAQFGAQLPMLVRGLYYEGWNPSAGRPRIENTRNFLDAVRHELRGHLELRDAAHVVKAVLGVVDRYVSAGEIDKIISSLRSEMRELWPEQQPAAVQ
jgi:uncharacterized protein (DUF2267 family)